MTGFKDFMSKVPEIEKAIGYTFKDKSLLRQAFTRGSFVNERASAKTPYQSYQVLEFLGDSVLSVVVASKIVMENGKRYSFGYSTDFAEKDFSNIKSRLSDKTNLSESITKLGIAKYLIMSSGDEKTGVVEKASVKEDLFESIVGAVYIDCDGNIEILRSLISGMLDMSVYEKKNSDANRNSDKNLLQEWCSNKARRLPLPRYETTSEGPDNNKLFTTVCYIGDREYGRAVGKNKKSAESNSAKSALITLMAEENIKPLTQKRASSADPYEKARQYAKLHGITLPEYRDKGEADGSTASTPRFEVECRFAGKAVSGFGTSKKDAKRDALSKLLSKIKA